MTLFFPAKHRKSMSWPGLLVNIWKVKLTLFPNTLDLG
jgi:hypothetical protein